MPNKRHQNRKKQVDSSPIRAVNPLVEAVKSLDAFSNVGARMGYGTPNLMESTAYPLVRLTKNYQLLNSLYRGNWIVRRIINLIPQDMMKNGWKYISDMTPEQIDLLQKQERLTQLRSKLLTGLQWGRLYGGAAGLMMIEGQEDSLAEPLDYEAIMPGDFKGLLIADRWSGVYPELELVDDIASPEFGLPKYYRFESYPERQVFTVHHSRILRFVGMELPVWEQWAEIYWGASYVENVFEEIKKRDNTSFNIANLVFQAKLKIIKMQDLGELLAGAPGKAQQDLYQTVQAQNWLMNNFGQYIMSKDDEFESVDYSFTGLAEVYEQFMMDVSGASQIPVTKLFGRSPAGMNATGESDLRNYYDVIEQEQEARLRPALEKLLPVLCRSALGEVPADFDFMFNPVYTSTDEEKGKKVEWYTKAIYDGFSSGLYSQQLALKELKQLSDDTGIFTNITDEDIASADEEVQDPMDMMMEGDPNAPGQPKKPGTSNDEPGE